MIKVLYVSYWGALEQLGQSLVVPAVKKLAQMGVEITIITFEKPYDLAREDEVNRVQEMFEKDNIEWIPLKYHKGIRSTPIDISKGVLHGLLKRLKKRYDILHARTYIGGLIGLPLASLIGAKFVYHNEGFYPDEQVDSGVWTENSRPHKIAKYLENKMYSRADGIISLSSRAKTILEKGYPNKPIIIVPSCVDLEHFKISKKLSDHSKEIVFVYVGSVGGRYLLDKIGQFVYQAKQLNPQVKLQIFSKSDLSLIKKELSQSGLSENDWQVEAVSYQEIPERLSKCDVGIHFLQKGISEHSGSPTKIGEYWASGLPVVITPNMSDNDIVAEKENVGVVVSEHSEEIYKQAFIKLSNLLNDKRLAERCRKAAESHYALSPSCNRQFALYERLLK